MRSPYPLLTTPLLLARPLLLTSLHHYALQARVKWFGRASRRADALRQTVARFPRQVLFGTDNFGSKARGERVYRDAVRASCLQLELERFSCPEFGNGGAASTSASAAASAAMSRAARASNARGSAADTVDHQSRLHGLGLKASPELLRSVLFENAARLLSSAGKG